MKRETMLDVQRLPSALLGICSCLPNLGCPLLPFATASSSEPMDNTLVVPFLPPSGCGVHTKCSRAVQGHWGTKRLVRASSVSLETC